MWCAASVLVVLTACTTPSWTMTFLKECNKGPEYWCSNLRTATECGASGHCLQTEWTKHKYEVDRDVVALKFTKLFEQLKQRDGKYDDEELQGVLDTACRSVPHASAGRRCKALLAGRAANVRMLLASELAPISVCSVLELCHDDKMDALLELPKHSKAENPKQHKQSLVGAKKCTWGPSYWCENFSNSHDCGATRHCVERVWSKKPVPEDNDDVCKICTDMVKQARDQLQSNETQEELKEVFEGSCKLIPIKLVAKECMRLADDFVPELVETLASEMNPSQVCSVAGLCNSARIDKLLQIYAQRKSEEEKGRKECSGCRRVVSLARSNFDNTKYEDFLINLLTLCRDAGSFSDACATHVFARYEEIMAAIREHLVPDSVCHLSGQCAHLYHSHSDDYVTLSSDGQTGVVTQDKDDLPCELCEQLVKHMRDVVVANTTETEFLTVLKGICKQTGNFKDECLSLVEQWYPVIYNYLVSELKPNEVCALGGICPNNNAFNMPIAPLIASQEVVVKAIPAKNRLVENARGDNDKRVPVASSVRVLGPEHEQSPVFALPIERMFPNLPAPVTNNAECIICEQVLHYIQNEISDTNNEHKIEDAVEHVCTKLPSSVSGECQQFVDAYGPYIIALLVQEIDPSTLCPAINVCPKIHKEPRVSVNEGHSGCPLCLVAVEQLVTVLNTTKTEESIRSALDQLCKPLSEKLKPECVDFVDKYSQELVETLIAGMNAQEICVFLKICEDKSADPIGVTSQHVSDIDKFFAQPHLRGDVNRIRKRPRTRDEKYQMIETNEIPDSTVNGAQVVGSEGLKDKNFCVICEFVMKEIDSEIKDKKNEDDLKRIVHNVCKRMPRSVRTECDQFVDKYADLVISMLSQELDADEVCREIKLCDQKPTIPLVKGQGDKNVCVFCEFVMKQIEVQLDDNEDEVKRIVHSVCGLMPRDVRTQCDRYVNEYADLIIALLAKGLKPDEVCHELKLCTAQLNVQQVKENILDCAVCEAVIAAVDKVLKIPSVDHRVVKVMEVACDALPAKYYDRCRTMMEIYGDSVISIIAQYGAKGVCGKIGLCGTEEGTYVDMFRTGRH